MTLLGVVSSRCSDSSTELSTYYTTRWFIWIELKAVSHNISNDNGCCHRVQGVIAILAGRASQQSVSGWNLIKYKLWNWAVLYNRNSLFIILEDRFYHFNFGLRAHVDVCVTVHIQCCTIWYIICYLNLIGCGLEWLDLDSVVYGLQLVAHMYSHICSLQVK